MNTEKYSKELKFKMNIIKIMSFVFEYFSNLNFGVLLQFVSDNS